MSFSSEKVRFAPSPTGRLHIGNARTAVLNWLFAKHTRGDFILRFDDTDQNRSRTEFAEGISEDLAWLGIVPDLVVKQSDRFALYADRIAYLKQKGRLYPCYETPEELDRKRKRQLARGLPPIYDRASLSLSEAEKKELEQKGVRPHWRFLLNRASVVWEDGIRGTQRIDTSSLSDPVLVREDGTYLYTLPSVVDDIDLEVSHVIRGEDHVVNTAVQIEIFAALGADIPHFSHHSLLIGKDGQGLSKRLGSLSLQGMRQANLEAMAIFSMAALLGTSTTVDVYETQDDLLKHFDLSSISRAPARFDEDELTSLNAKLLHKTPFHNIRSRLLDLARALDLLQAPTEKNLEDFWFVVRGNLSIFPQCEKWLHVVYGTIATFPLEPAFLEKARACLPYVWDQSTWKTWTNTLKEETGRQGKELFHPLRLALTGEEKGPELGLLLPLLSRESVLERLKNCGK